MNYKKIYLQLIEKAKNANRIKLNRTNENYVFYENHHIIPKAEGGLNTDENMVLLTPKEHYIAHLLLAKITGTKSQIFAFNLMSNRTGNSHNYTLFREELSNIISEQTKKYIEKNGHPKGMLGKNHSIKTKKILSEISSNRTYPSQKGKFCVKDKDGNIIKISKEDFDKSSEYESIHKGMVVVKDKDGNNFLINKDDPRYLSGELVHVTKGIFNESNNPNAKKYKLISPNNDEYIVHGFLERFCKEHELSWSRITQHKNKGKLPKDRINAKYKCEGWEIIEL